MKNMRKLLAAVLTLALNSNVAAVKYLWTSHGPQKVDDSLSTLPQNPDEKSPAYVLIGTCLYHTGL